MREQAVNGTQGQLFIIDRYKRNLSALVAYKDRDTKKT